MKGLGTDDESLIRVVVSRCEIDMVQIKDAFKAEYNQTLGEFIKVDYLFKASFTLTRLLNAAFINFRMILPEIID